MSLTRVFQLLSSPQRLRLLFLIGSGEACVCHLEASTGWRQAYISQQLQALRKGGLLKSLRRGKFVYYRLAQPQLLDQIIAFAGQLGLTDELSALQAESPGFCECPSCQVHLHDVTLEKLDA